MDKFADNFKQLMTEALPQHSSMRTETEKIFDSGNCNYHRAKLR
jgi:hypothetical protein